MYKKRAARKGLLPGCFKGAEGQKEAIAPSGPKSPVHRVRPENSGSPKGTNCRLLPPIVLAPALSRKLSSLHNEAVGLPYDAPKQYIEAIHK